MNKSCKTKRYKHENNKKSKTKNCKYFVESTKNQEMHVASASKYPVRKTRGGPPSAPRYHNGEHRAIQPPPHRNAHKRIKHDWTHLPRL